MLQTNHRIPGKMTFDSSMRSAIPISNALRSWSVLPSGL